MSACDSTPIYLFIVAIYLLVIAENLVPNVFLELFFVLQLLTCRSPPTLEADRDRDRHGLGASGQGETNSH